MTAVAAARRAAQDLPLFWKLLVPFFALLLLVALSGTAALSHDVAVRAQTAVDTDLGLLDVAARTAVRERELALLESLDFAANLTGMGDAVARHDRTRATRLLHSVVAVRSELAVAAVTDARGAVVAQVVGRGGSASTEASPAWVPGVHRMTLDGGIHAALVDVGRTSLLLLAGPVCRGQPPCRRVGTAVVGLPAAALVPGSLGEGLPGSRFPLSGLAVLDTRGRVRAATGRLIAREPPALTGGRPVRRNEKVDGAAVATLYSPLQVRGQVLGTYAVSVSRAAATASARGSALHLAGLLLAALMGIVAIGALLSRFILVRVQSLVATHRALGGGDLTARAPVRGRDELGELARGVNQMAEQLQSSQRMLEQRVEERTAAVRRLLHERSELFAAITHDLRTPLAVIRGQVRLQSDPAVRRSTRRLAESARTVDQAALQMLRIVGDILRLAETESQAFTLDLNDVCLATLVDDLLPTMTRLTGDAAVGLEVEIPPELPVVVADPTRIGEVVLNLVDNAAKYTPAGGQVCVSATSDGSMVAVTVTDTGVGIPPEVGARVFEPFFRVAGTTTQAGQPSSGLGLAVAHRVIDLHDGLLTYTSSDAGTAFTFTLPRARAG